ncbi:MAG: bifunctional YncE family protein/alkaline phosphatase family protein [Bryobacteraceae bacterium]|nr:bifunctional YncE family protein/alkaline phosphatase family protein [Bryobacteraceae bacterium]
MLQPTLTRTKILSAALLFAAVATLVSKERDLFAVLPSGALLGKQATGDYLVATNQLLRPAADQRMLLGRPVDLALDSQKRWLAVLNMRGINLLDASTGAEIGTIETKSTSYTGVAFRPGDREVWASEATRTGPDSILITSLDDRGKPGEKNRITLPGHPVPAGLAFSADGATAWVALTNKNSVAVIDTASRKIIREISTGAVPYSVAFSAKRKRLYVTNRGGKRPSSTDTKTWSSETEVATDPDTGSTTTGSISVIDLETYREGQIETGLAPAGLALSPDQDTLAVANAHSDSLTLVDLDSLKPTSIKLPSYPEGSFGVTPASLAFAPDGKALYVACGGTNAIYVLRGEKDRWKFVGALPSGWFPAALSVDGDGALRVINVKGVGSTANKSGTHNSREYEGSIWKIPAPSDMQLEAGLRQVAAANSPRFEPATGVNDLTRLGIRHVFLIIKENRTYDQVFGDMPKGNNDKNLAIYGRNVTPNHHALAEQFVLLDNFYTGGAISFDGHQWLMQGFVSDYVERGLTSAPRGYAWNMADALTVAPTGFFWQDRRRPLSVRLYGPFSQHIRWDPATHRAVDIDEGDLNDWQVYWDLYKNNQWRDAVGNRSGVPALQKLVSPRYPASSMNITDQIRAEAWLEELAQREKSGEMPNLLIFTMTSDHTMGKRPGFPTPRAMVADNDFALGRMVEGISKSRFWQNSLILVTEDDAQDGVDHVDGRRTIAMAIGPHIRRGVLDNNHYNHSSMIRTIQDIFKIQPRVRYAASARAMNSVFDAAVNKQPYTALQPEVSLTEMNPPVSALKGRQLWAAQQSMKLNGKNIDDFPAQVMNRILWWDAKGDNTPYPERKLK